MTSPQSARRALRRVEADARRPARRRADPGRTARPGAAPPVRQARPPPPRPRPRSCGPRRRPGMPTFAELGLPEPLLRALDGAAASPPRSRSRPPPCPTRSPAATCSAAARPAPARRSRSASRMLARLAGGRARPRRPRGAGPGARPASSPPQVVDALLPFAKALGLTADRRGRRHVLPPPGRRAAARRRPARRHAGPARRPHRPGHLLLDDVAITAIDEADRMADMGFLPQVRRILDQHPVRRPAAAVLRHPRRRRRHARPALPAPTRSTRSIDPATAAVDTMEHHLLLVDARAKNRGRHRDRRPRGPHDHVRPHEARRRPAGQAAAPGRHRRRRAARRQGAERRATGRSRRSATGVTPGARRHRRRRARHPRRRREPRRPRRPARRPQGLPAPRRPHRAGRRVGHRRHDGHRRSSAARSTR